MEEEIKIEDGYEVEEDQPKEEIKHETKHVNKPKRKMDIWKISAIVLFILLLISIFTNGFTDFSFTGMAVNQNTYNGDKVNLEFYVMSQCPYGTMVEDAIKPVLDNMPGVIDFHLDFIANVNPDGTFSSLHGEPEVQGDIVQLCAAKHEPEKYMDMIECMNKDAANIPNNWEACATNLNTEVIKTCYEGEEGKQLLVESIARSNEAKASGSPTMFINGKSFSARKTSDMMKAVCAEINNEHEACKTLPEPVKVQLTIINDKECPECDTTELKSVFSGMFTGLSIQELDFEDAKDLMEENDVELLPAYIFDSKVTETDEWKSNANLQTAFEKIGDNYVVVSDAVGATHDPLKEICDNEKDDRDQDGLVDCEDDDCSDQWICLPKLDKPEIELFVMSHCPYGTQIEKGMLPIVKLLGDKIDFKVKFCDYAMHGEKEINEQLQQYCIQEEFNDKYLGYLECFLEDSDSNKCVEQLKIDKEKLDKCISDADKEFKASEGLKDQSAWKGNYPPFAVFQQEVDKYEVRGSPTLVINGVVAEGVGRSPAALLSGVCLGFAEQPSECSETLSSENPAPGFGLSATSAATADASCS